MARTCGGRIGSAVESCNNGLLNGEPAPDLAEDAALLGGVAAYEAMRTYGGGVFGMAAHLSRLRASAVWMGIPWPGEKLLADEIVAVTAGATT